MAYRPTRKYSEQTGPSLLELVKQLRADTKAGIADCRDALVASHNDIGKAKEWLHERAKKTASKKRDRKTQEGGVLVHINGARALLVEVNTETDFASREPEFAGTVRKISDSVMGSSVTQMEDRAALLQTVLDLPCKTTVSGMDVSDVREAVQQLTFLFKENIKLARVALFPVVPSDSAKTHFFSYVHGSLDSNTPKIGKMGALVQLSIDPSPSETQLAAIKSFANVVSTQIIGGKPMIVTREKAERPSYVDPAVDFTSEPDYEPQLLEQESVIKAVKFVKFWKS